MIADAIPSLVDGCHQEFLLDGKGSTLHARMCISFMQTSSLIAHVDGVVILFLF